MGRDEHLLVRRAASLGALIGAAGLLVACGTEVSRTQTWSEGRDEVGGQVVATVDGHGITVAEVEAELERQGGSPREALDRLVEQELVAAEAERRGYGEERAVELAQRRSLVRGLLEVTVERRIRPEQITTEDLRAAYAQSYDRFHKGPRRRVEHVLVRVGEDAARAEVERARRAAAAHLAALHAGDPATVLAELGAQRHELPTSVEDLGVFDRNVGFVAPFRDAVFGVDQPGVLPTLVRTEFGWHAIWVREVLPPIDVPFEEAAPRLREEILTARRHEALQALEAQLREDYPVVLDETRARTLLARDPLAGRAGS